MSNLGQTLLIPAKGASSSATAESWMDERYDSRFVVTATNPSATLPLYDHVFTITVPNGVTVDADSMRVVEGTSLGGVDSPNSWRYKIGINVNKMRYLPASISGSTITVKSLGKWAAAETRYFHVYWDSTSAIAATSYSHLNGAALGWSALFVAGNTGDTYTVNAGGVAYTHVMTAGQTATQIAQAVRTLINAGAVALATGAGATLTISQTDLDDGTFSVTNTGSILTGSGAITITKATFFGAVTRVGPDTDTFAAGTFNFIFGYPFHNPATSAAVRPGWGRGTDNLVRAMTYNVNSVGAQQLTGGVVTSVTHNGPTTTVTGTLTFPLRSGDYDWTGSYTATHRHVIFTGRKSDDTGAGTLDKWVDATRVVLTYTCNRAYTPAAVSSSATALGGHELISLADLLNAFGGNATEAAGNKISNFYAPISTGTITAYTSGDAVALTALDVPDMIIGAHGNANGYGIFLNSAPTLTNFGSQSPEAKWTTQGNAFGVLHLRNLVTTSTIPVGATIVLDFWIVSGWTTNATTVGDNFLPDEVVALCRSLKQTPTVVAGSLERYSAAVPLAAAKRASTYAVEGCQWHADNALTIAGLAVNTGFSYNQITATPYFSPDDDDGGYGESHKLHGLCLRYLRLREPSVLTQIERQVQFHIDIEQAAVTAYGSWYEGSAPYWYAAAAVTKTGSEGGISNGDRDDLAGGVPNSTISYAIGEVRRLTSIDQIHMVAHGLYAYRYLLRNEAAVTANTTLWANALSLIGRMRDFEVAHFATGEQVCGNLYQICTGATPTTANGIDETHINTDIPTAMATPYYGNTWGTWQVSNTDVLTYETDANSGVNYFFRALWSPDSTVAGVKKYLQGRALDLSTGQVEHHDTVTANATWSASAAEASTGEYPYGWGIRAGATGIDLKYASRAGDDHFIRINASTRDAFNGRIAQRLGLLCIAAMMDPTYQVTMETEGTDRTVLITDLVDQMTVALATYMFEPTTKTGRWGVPGWLGGANNFTPSTSNINRVVDSAMTGYLMWAMELAILVKSGANYADYYPIGTW